MENATLVELKPNRELLDPNFSGYKLSLDPIPMYDTTLPAKVDRVLRSEEQFSLQHVKLFGLHNHLLYDPWNLDDVYYVDTDDAVRRNVLDKESGKLTGVSKVWKIPTTHLRHPGHYSPSGYFPAKDLVLFSDGSGSLHLVETGERVKSDKAESQWQVLFTDDVCGKDVPFVIVNARTFAEEKDESGSIIVGRKVHCLLLHVEEAKKVRSDYVVELPQRDEKGSKSSHTSFLSVLEWIILEEDKDGDWSLGRVRKLCGTAIPDYAAVCEDGISLTISSEEPFIFPKLIDEVERSGVFAPVNLKEIDGFGPAEIEWTENHDEVILTLPLVDDLGDDRKIVVKVTHGKQVTITVNDKVMLEGSVCHPLEDELTTWEKGRHSIVFTFMKKRKGSLWNKIVDKAEPEGVEKVDPAVGEEVNKLLAHLTSEQQDTGAGTTPVFNSQELEDCDEASTKDASLCRFDGETLAVTHKVIISQWLFNAQLDSSAMPVICLRDDVDALLWQPKCDKLSEAASKKAEEIWSCTHVASFSTFGYVQASKERKKFNVCASDTSYVAVCEASTYIYIYRQPAQLSQDTQLRNRRTGEKVSHVARQQLITLPNAQEVLGVHASSTTLYVLMEDKLLMFVLNQ